MTDFENFEIFSIDNTKNNDRRKPIVEYLKNSIGMPYRKTKYRVLSYIIIRKISFKKTPEGVLLKCLSET